LILPRKTAFSGDFTVSNFECDTPPVRITPGRFFDVLKFMIYFAENLIRHLDNLIMKRVAKILLVAMFSFFAVGVRAQTWPDSKEEFARRDLKLFEFEFGTGLNFARSWAGLKTKPGANFILELRLNRPEPFDFGLQLKMGNFVHQQPDVFKVNSKFIFPSVFADYNHRYRNTTLFAGIGAGVSFMQNETTLFLSPSSGLISDYVDRGCFAVTPRAGVMVLNMLRITVEYVFTRADYSRFNLNFGFVFGGSYKIPGRRRSLTSGITYM
jgi:hypothetical protein